MQLDIVTPDKKVFSGKISGVKVPGSDGAVELLNNHAPIISTLEKGAVRIKTKDGEQNIEIDGGILEMLNNKIIILAEAVLV